MADSVVTVTVAVIIRDVGGSHHHRCGQQGMMVAQLPAMSREQRGRRMLERERGERRE
jgi:hypothetical protein